MGSTTRTSGSTSAVAPAWAVLAVTWLGSIGTAVGWSGVFFITEVAYGFDERSNLILGAGLGLVYAISALVAGPVVTRLIDARPGLSRRAVLALVCTGMGAAAMIPASTPDVWAIWVFAGVFITLQGLMWPLVEAYLSGGRRGRAMRSITGRFNIVWASAIVVAMWGMAVFMENQPRLILGLLGVAMFATAVLLAWFPREPAPHVEEDASEHEIDPDRAIRLLRVFRVSLLCSYALHAALTPLLPHLLEDMGLSEKQKTPFASIWMASRLGMFILMERWHGWHGRWRTFWWACGLMLAGFAVCSVSPVIASQSGDGPGLWAMGAGLCLLGAGIGAVYAAALYYAMEAGPAAVESGGKHEGMIGLGYTAGPVMALVVGGEIIGLF
ncbi:MAG: MFS transporter [bacterium]|nr:MFS transporter [bacterium]